MGSFYLGTHQVDWVGQTSVPLFISHTRLRRYAQPPRTAGPWALDSGAFSELSLRGQWDTSEGEYMQAALFYADEVGQPDWIAPMDWMCEPFMLKRTGLSVLDHQRLTVENVLSLRQLAGGMVHVIPVLQGWATADYLRCWERYERAGVHLEDEPTVGVGSVCRRQATAKAFDIFAALEGLRLHGFGVKIGGLERLGRYLSSCDSMAWSYEARSQKIKLPGHAHVNCANCIDYALLWREKVLERL